MGIERIAWSPAEAPVASHLRRRLVDEGCDVMMWHEQPRRVYGAPSHAHDEGLRAGGRRRVC